ncbi:MAG: protein kinase [bacterium]
MTGKTILHYEILAKLGEGGMGVVYKAEDKKLERTVAIKFLPHHIAANSEERERFKTEAKAAAALNHPNIATIHAIEEVDDEMFIVMEYIEGRELKEIISDQFSVNRIIEIATQIAAGLQAAHEKGVVHRDIKSANIMVTGNGQVKIMDFGLAKVRGGALVTQVGTTLGTAAYMSPEQARGEEVDQRTDIWAFGVVLYEMLTGELPFKGDYEQAVIYAILNTEPEPVTSHRDDTPPELAAIVSRCLAKDPEQRYSSTAELMEACQALSSTKMAPGALSLSALLRTPRFAVPVVLLLIGVGLGTIWWVRHNTRVRWVRQQLVPQIQALVQDLPWTGEGPKSWAAFQLSEQAAQVVPHDPLLKLLRRKFSQPVKIYSAPPGARVFAKAYADSGQAWRYFGETSLDSIDFPIGFSRIKLENDGYKAAYDIVWNAAFLNDTLRYKLTPTGSIPDDMELVPQISSWYHITGAPAGLHMPGLEQHPFVPVGDFLMDRYEVSNREYKKFVDAGGYQSQSYWKYPFRKDGQKLSWKAAMALFTDKTGQPGPSTWEVGDYLEGQADAPVTGVSWHEAVAYAEFAGKSLPTIYHWDRVAFTWASPAIVPSSNLTSSRPEAVGQTNSMNRFGIFDLAGNVREWCINQSSRGGRFILGGGWNDPPYAFNDAYAQNPFDRTETNGFRCIRYLQGEAEHVELEKTIQLPFRDFLNEKSVSDATFKLFLRQYDYDRAPMHAVIESTQEAEYYIRQKIAFDAAYGNERMMAYLFLPKNSQPLFQTVVYFPGSGAIHTRSSERLGVGSRNFILKSGRALMYPIYKSTFERGDDLHSDYPNTTNFWKDHVIMWAKDFRRSIDYLETREDIDSERMAYYGISWGGAMGGIIPAVEKRIKTSVLLVAGLLFQPALPEVEPVNFLPRITMPVLMLNGKYDFFFPYETSQRPFFELLGTAKKDRKLFLYEGGHSVPRTELVKEMLTWLDHYLGPVNK